MTSAYDKLINALCWTITRRLNRDSIELGVGVKVLQANNMSMDFDLVPEFAGDQQSYTGSVGFK